MNIKHIISIFSVFTIMLATESSAMVKTLQKLTQLTKQTTSKNIAPRLMGKKYSMQNSASKYDQLYQLYRDNVQLAKELKTLAITKEENERRIDLLNYALGTGSVLTGLFGTFIAHEKGSI